MPLLTEHKKFQPLAKAGTLDLRQWDINQHGTVPLDGEWRFYPQQFVKATPLTSTDNKFQSSFIQVPGAWNRQQLEGKPIPTQGYATYQLKVLLPVDAGTFGIKTRNIRSANQLFVNGKVEGLAGTTGKTRANSIEKNQPYVAFFEVNASELDIILHVSSFEGFSSGISHSIFLGDERAIANLDNQYFVLDSIFCAGFLLAGIYFLSLYFQRRQIREQLYFALFSFSIVLYFLTTSERLLWRLFPDITILTHLYLQILASLSVCMFLSLYLYYSLQHIYSKRVIKTVVMMTVTILLLLPFLPISLFMFSTVSIMAFMVSVLLVDLYYLAKAMRNPEPGSLYIAIGFFAIMLLFPLAILNIMFTVDLYYFLPFSLPILAISQALYMSQKYTNAFQIIQRLSEQLQSLNLVKDEFLAKTSHELKTPLNGIINISQSLLDGAGGPLQTAHQGDVQLIRDIGKRLSTLVHDILDYSKAKNHDLVLNRRSIDLYGVARVLVEVFSFSQKTGQVQLVNRIEPETYRLYADENRLNQILYNLVENALKYSDEGVVEILAENEGSMVSITIRDSGRGIAAEDQKRIFSSFEQLEPSLTRAQGGVGLGLAITKQLVELHGGTISVKSKVGIGSSFTFSIPVASADEKIVESLVVPDSKRPIQIDSEQSDNWTHSSVIDDAKFSVLIVDDEYSNIRAISNVLSLEGYNVAVAMNGKDALLKLESGPAFDLIILDVMMPGMSGYEVCTHIRNDYTALQLPVLMLTARSQNTDLAIGFAAGANDFIEKPFDSVELKSRIQTLVQLKRSMNDLVSAELSMLQTQIQPHFIFNVLSAVISFCYSDSKRAAKLLTDFSDYLRKSMRYIQSSRWISIREEITFVHAYLAIEEVRFGDRMRVDLAINPEIFDVNIPPLTIQPLIENAIKHGIMTKEDGGHVKVSVERISDEIQITVTDDGDGMSEEMVAAINENRKLTDSFALYNISSRLRRLTGRGLHVTSQVGNGTTVEFVVPANIKSYSNTL